MKNLYVSDEQIADLVQKITNNDRSVVAVLLNQLENDFPADERIHFLRYAHRASIGQIAEAADDLWSCMDIKPQDTLFLESISDLLITKKVDMPKKPHNLQLTSGERQTASAVEKIRSDHTARYKLAATLLQDKHKSCSNLKGLDLFCGNGYGSRIIHDQTGARMLGIDGSMDAVTLANQSYGNHRTIFLNHYFPFEVQEKSFDFTVCYESIEHVEDCEGLLAQAIRASRGSVFISVPSEENLPFSKHEKFFKFHHRHFTVNEILSLCNQFSSHEVKMIYGQSVYEIKHDKIAGLIPQEKMYMKPTFTESQFHILHLEPKI
jgi:2-polyprenyl-3-methyl-5-hydroxy-6-metoxy-1,4-benzoquinol methylase